MKLAGGVYVSEDGLSTSVRDMHLQTVLFQNSNTNIVGFNKVGFQRRVPVVSSFASLLGANAFSETTDTQVGRLSITKRPLDFALNKEGYFQYKTPEGIKLTRDGRFKMDKNGFIKTQEGYNVLSSAGQLLKLPIIPEELKNIKVDKDGQIQVIDPVNFKVYKAGQFSIVSNEGSILRDVDVRQGYIENSNINLQYEFLSMLPIRRNFEANRQMFLIQNDQLSKTIQELGRPG